MQRAIPLYLVSVLAGTLAAQSNTVPGLDGRLTVVDNFTYQGRRGAAHPNGEVGAAMLNTMCNPGTVNIPWYSAGSGSGGMNEDHPKFGFLMVRLANDRMEQISDRSHVKHAFTSTNFSGACGTCISPGTGSLMGVHCSDTYGVGNNADRNWLGPAGEINPWLGTWTALGSYFDVGDNGASPVDGVKGTMYSGSDSVKNRVTMQEQDLLTPGAQYFYGIHLVHAGEAVANRWDNLASRGCTPNYSGSSWSFSSNSVGQVYGSILQHWTGATLDSGGNGSNDGRFFVAAKVTPLGGGNYHYEYAVHNADNHRGGATLRIPIDAAGTASNFTFGDIDANPLNNWTAARVGNEIVFSAPANNSLDWNTIYNFGFDCNVAASTGPCEIDQARVGPGALSVTVTTKIPSGLPGADYTLVGQGCVNCAASFYQTGAFDLANSKIKLTYTPSGYQIGVGTATFVTPTGGDLNQSDDDVDTFNLGFSMPYPGGTTSSLLVCSNGFVSPGASNGNSWTPTSADFLSGNPRWAPCWRDLTPSGANDVYAQVISGVGYVTWLNVNNFSQANSPNTFQMQFRPNGDVDIVYQTMTPSGVEYLVGWTPGGGAQDPGSTDLSAVLGAGFSICGVDMTPVTLGVSDRPVLNTSIDFLIGNLPASASVAVMALSITSFPPGIDLGPVLDMEGCYAYGLPDGISGAFAVAAPGASWSFFVPNLPFLIGQTTMFQSLVVAPGFTGSGYLTTNGVELLYGSL